MWRIHRRRLLLVLHAGHDHFVHERLTLIVRSPPSSRGAQLQFSIYALFVNLRLFFAHRTLFLRLPGMVNYLGLRKGPIAISTLRRNFTRLPAHTCLDCVRLNPLMMDVSHRPRQISCPRADPNNKAGCVEITDGITVRIRVGIDAALESDRVTLHISPRLRIIIPMVVVMYWP